MAISRPGGTLPGRFPLGHRGRLSARHMPDGSIVVQAPPRKRPGRVSGWKLKQRLLFEWVEKQTRILEPTMRNTCEILAAGTKWTWRDVATMMIIGTYYAIELPDGTILEGARLSNPDPQYVLDLVTQAVGSILMRNDLGWVGLPPGTDGDVLTQDAGLPSWKPPGGGGGTGYELAVCDVYGAGANSSSYATKGMIFEPAYDLDIAAIATNLQVPSGHKYKGTILQLDATSGSPHVLAATQTAEVTPPSLGTYQVMRAAFATPVTITAGSIWALCMSVSNQSDTTAIYMTGRSTGVQPPLIQGAWPNWLLMPKKAPTVGDTGTTSGASGGGFSLGIEYAPH